MRGIPITDEQSRKLTLALNSGYTIRQAARIARVSEETARKRRVKLFGPMKPPKLTEAQRQEILKRVRGKDITGEKLTTIAADYGVSESWVCHLHKRREEQGHAA